MFTQLRPALVMLSLFTVLTGIAYPLVLTGLAQVLFPVQANGSLIIRGDEVVGSRLVGQAFSSDRYFWGRPSAASKGYDAASSSGSNFGPTSKSLIERVKGDVARFGGSPESPVPADVATASASGLDPDISPATALLQVDRIAAARGLAPDTIRALANAHIARQILGFIGEPRVNVLDLNLALDAMPPAR